MEGAEMSQTLSHLQAADSLVGKIRHIKSI